MKFDTFLSPATSHSIKRLLLKNISPAFSKSSPATYLPPDSPQIDAKRWKLTRYVSTDESMKLLKDLAVFSTASFQLSSPARDYILHFAIH